ncbi:MAG: hypothetical protein ACTS6J_00030 [Burkholderiales bacterium]
MAAAKPAHRASELIDAKPNGELRPLSLPVSPFAHSRPGVSLGLIALDLLKIATS